MYNNKSIYKSVLKYPAALLRGTFTLCGQILSLLDLKIVKEGGGKNHQTQKERDS